MSRRLAMVRRPSPRLADGLVTHIDKQPVDVDLAMHQWATYVDAFHDAGWETVEAPFVDSPDAAFIEDQMVVFKTRAVLTRSGAPERRDEQVGLRELLRHTGYDTFEMTSPAMLDGGDVLKHQSTLWVGDGGDAGRSNDAGRAMLHDVFSPIGGHVITVPNTASLHLKSSVTTPEILRYCTARRHGHRLRPHRRPVIHLAVLPGHVRRTRRSRRTSRRQRTSYLRRSPAICGTP